MPKVPGKSALVTYEVVTDDSEIESILGQILSEVISPLVNQSKDALIKKVRPLATVNTSDTNAPAQASQVSAYKRENVDTPFLIPLGGRWAYSVSVVTNQSGHLAVRVSKGRIKGGFYRDKRTNEMVLTPDDPQNPISQAVHINIDRLKDWERLQAPVIQRLRQIEQEATASAK